MKSVSTAYAESMASLFRNRSYVKITFQNVDADAAADGYWVANDEAAWSDLSTLDYEHSYGPQLQTGELNRWILDGSGIPMPDDYDVLDGYASDAIADADGVFGNPKPKLTREFSSAMNLIGLTLIFDIRANTWPTNITIKMYDGASVVYNEDLDVSDVTLSVVTSTPSVSKIEITFNKALPYSRARLEQTLYGVVKVFQNEDVVSVQQKHDIDPLTRRLPSEKFTFVALDYDRAYDPDNSDGYYEYIDVNAPVYVQYGYELDTGDVEWIKPDRYRLDGKPTVDKDQASFSATGLIGSMTDTYYKDTVGTKTFYDMAISVLQDANLPPTPSGADPWDVDISLQNLTTTAVLPIATHMNCLQLIAHACCCKLYTDDDNVIHIKPFDVGSLSRSSDFVLDFDSALKNAPKVSKINALKAVTVAKFSYMVAGSSSELYKGTTTGTNLHVEFSNLAQDVSISVSGGSLVSSQIYGRAADLVLSSGGTKTVTITGKELKEASAVLTFPIGPTGDIDEEKNKLITSDDMATALANHVATYLAYRNTYDVEYRGNPEFETGDVIGLQSRNTAEMDALILTDEISFNGALHGKMKLKGLM